MVRKLTAVSVLAIGIAGTVVLSTGTAQAGALAWTCGTTYLQSPSPGGASSCTRSHRFDFVTDRQHRVVVTCRYFNPSNAGDRDNGRTYQRAGRWVSAIRVSRAHCNAGPADTASRISIRYRGGW
jgi:hypothetical protein